MTRVTGVAKSERFLRAAAGIDVDKDDVERCNDFINQNVYDQLLIGQANARANEHDMVQPHDLPITKACRRRSTNFAAWTQVWTWSLCVALARTLKIVDPSWRTRRRSSGDFGDG